MIYYYSLAHSFFFRGTLPHKSHDDPTDPENVISVRLFNEKEQRLAHSISTIRPRHEQFCK